MLSGRAESRADIDRRREIGRERCPLLAWLETIVVREGVGGELLIGRGENPFDQRGREVQRIVALAGADFVEREIRRQGSIAISRALLGQCAEHLRFGAEKKHADRGPGGVNAELAKQGEHARYREARAEQVLAIGVAVVFIAHTPAKLEVERDHEATVWHGDHFWGKEKPCRRSRTASPSECRAGTDHDEIKTDPPRVPRSSIGGGVGIRAR